MIRPATPADVPDLQAMIVELAEYEKAAHEVRTTEAHLHDALFGPDARAHAHVAVEPGRPAAGAVGGTAADGGGRVVGMALWFVNFSTWRGVHGIYLEDLYVRPQHRGAGHGRALLAGLASLCVERGYARLEWSVLDWNEPSIGFYRALGAVAMEEWTVYRLTDESLHALAAGPPDADASRP